MPETQVVFAFSTRGMNGALNPALLEQDQYSRGVNVQIKDQMPSTRIGSRVIPIDGDVEDFERGNIQGATFYNPGRGLSAQSFAEDNSSIMVSSAGVKFKIVPGARKASVARATIQRVDPIETSPDYHIVSMFQAENYLVSGDGNSDTWIWSGSGQSFLSKGINTTDKEKSELPSGAMIGVYAHGRVIQSVDELLIVGDSIHKSDLTGSSNILETTEQVYWATGRGFKPPTRLGEILAIELLPIMNTNHGHGDVMIHCEHGIFSLDINIFPRDNWQSTPMTRIVLMDTGARGPFAVALYDGDQIFRSRHGIQTLRSAAAENQLIGNPYHPISEEVQTWLDRDYPGYVRFCNVSKWATARRLFCTTSMFVDGFHRGARGVLSLNFAPVDSQMTDSSWEGLWTYPSKYPQITQMVNGVFNGRDRIFGFHRDPLAGKNYLVEYSRDLDHDVLPDGSISRISCQVISREIDMAKRTSKSSVESGVLMLRNVRGDLDWGVWLRKSKHDQWIKWRAGKIDEKDEPCGSEALCDEAFRGRAPQDYDLDLGTIPEVEKTGRRFQFLIRWRGAASIEGMTVKHTGANEDDGDKPPSTCIDKWEHCDYSDFEYSDPDQSNRWEN